MATKTKHPQAKLQAEAERLIRSGKMPSLDEVKRAIAEVRAKYRPLVQFERTDSGTRH